jgi:hypothetical protein
LPPSSPRQAFAAAPHIPHRRVNQNYQVKEFQENKYTYIHIYIHTYIYIYIKKN